MRLTGGDCLPTAILTTDAVLAIVDGAIAAVAFLQLFRIHMRSRQLGWTRQKIFHLLIGSSNLGYLVLFILTPFASCYQWTCWPDGCGFILMACPQIIFLAAFLLLISFWVDLCHQANDEEEEEDELSFREALLKKFKSKPGPLHADSRRHRGCFHALRIGSRQKLVILVVVVTFVFMIACGLLIWIGKGENPIDSSLMAKAYLDIFSSAIFILGCALACYGLLLFSKMRKVRSEMASAETWKVASLAAVSLISFTSSAVVAFFADAPLEVLSFSANSGSDQIVRSILLFLYYFIGFSVPSSFVLWVMREMPPQIVVDRPTHHRAVTIIRERATITQDPQWKTTVTSSQEKALKSSPI